MVCVVHPVVLECCHVYESMGLELCCMKTTGLHHGHVGALCDADGVACDLRGRFVKFQCVHALSVFIEDNQGGGETTRVQKIALLGQPAEKMDVAAIKKAGEEEA